jgi:hypothetical protein
MDISVKKTLPYLAALIHREIRLKWSCFTFFYPNLSQIKQLYPDMPIMFPCHRPIGKVDPLDPDNARHLLYAMPRLPTWPVHKHKQNLRTVNDNIRWMEEILHQLGWLKPYT